MLLSAHKNPVIRLYRLDRNAFMDSLSHLVRMLAPSGSVDLRCQFAGSWFVTHEPAPPGRCPTT